MEQLEYQAAPPPRIYLALPNISGITELFIQNLQHHGFDVISTDIAMQFSYPSFSARLQTKYRQLLLGERDAKLRLQSKIIQQELSAQLNGQPVDYALIIRSDLLHPELLTFIRRNTRHTMVAYQWDGIQRYPNIWRTIPHFDRFFVFDPADLAYQQYPLLPTTNFYFDHLPTDNTNTDNNFYFLGFHNDDRAAGISNFARYAKQQAWQLNFNILWNQEPSKFHNFYPENVNFITSAISFDENQVNIRNSKILVDFVIQAHHGLSFRTFEALHYQKKLITTNTQIRYYDFYHPDNIFIWDGLSFDGITDFLKQPYYEIDTPIKERYSFGNWIRYILDIPPYDPISLPKITI